ncbi:hypothetical protein N568_0109120 [Lactococcus garvieae TRF1]|uniref:Adhesin n=1 Tax=Lactococcus garvieae TRF1 TaxID=1380772 RepID=V8ANM2_9LACT|nr:hypothetical protein N568_0109120 [Lactococcus garvieae TRF1]
MKRVCKFIFQIVCLLATVFLLSIENRIFADSAKDVSNDLTFLEFSSGEARDGETITVNFKFEDKKMQIKTGDFINITWLNTDLVKGEGFEKAVDLTVKNKIVGTLTVSKNQAQVKFNDNITGLTDIQGWGTFDIQVRNFSESSAAVKLLVEGGGLASSIQVKKEQTGNNSTLFYNKMGDMLPDDPQHVRWFLTSNINKTEVEQPVFIKDQIQGGQRLDPSTFVIQVIGYAGYKEYTGEQGVSKFLNDYPGVGLTYSAQTNVIDIYIPTNIARYQSIVITYKTSIEVFDQEKFLNKSQAWYKEYGKPAVSGKEFDYTVVNTNISGGIDGKYKGQLKITKKLKGTNITIPNVEFNLNRLDHRLIDGAEVISLTTNSNGEAVVKNLEEGQYEVREVNAPKWISFNKSEEKYAFSIEKSNTKETELTIFNSKKTEDITANKIWNGGPDSKPTIYFKLFRKVDGSEKEEVPHSEIKKLINGQTETMWSNVEQYDDYGNAYSFSVEEVNKNGQNDVPTNYTKKEEGTTVTNTYTPELTTVSGTKIWEDNNNHEGTRPSSITVNLLADNVVVDKKIVKETDGWSYTFANLPLLKEGNEIKYSIEEEKVPGYKTIINGFNLTNQLEKDNNPTSQFITVNKVWDDYNNQDNLRPNSIQVQLYKDGKALKDKILTLDESNHWKSSFIVADGFSSKKDEHYSVKEISNIKRYSTTIDTVDNNVTITNHHVPKYFKVSGEKIWKDNNDQKKKRPTSITINLLANNKIIAQKKVTALENWKYEFIDLPVMDKGKQINYRITEDKVPGYRTSVEKFNIINTIEDSISEDSISSEDEDLSAKLSKEKETEMIKQKQQLPKTGTLNQSLILMLSGVMLSFVGYIIHKLRK